MEFKTQNTHALAPLFYPWLAREGSLQESRNGQVLRAPGVVTITLEKPLQCVNFSVARDANPFFHLIEALAMLVNHNSVELLSYYAKNMLLFSDNGKDYNAFYGSRARNYRVGSQHITGMDQLKMVIDILDGDPGSRQALLQLWNPYQDLGAPTKDKACNLCMIFEVDAKTGAVNMTTFNRSNDAIWGGVSGANVVHLPMFQQYVALALGREVGVWNHTSANLHVYTGNPKWEAVLKEARDTAADYSHDPLGQQHNGKQFYPPVCPLWGRGQHPWDFDVAVTSWLRELEEHNRNGTITPRPHTGFPLIDWVAAPMAEAFLLHKNGIAAKPWRPLLPSDGVLDCDWISAGQKWLDRRHADRA